jgi:hypothetical protein
MRIKEESRDLQEPPAKRILIDEDVSLNMRMTPIGLPGANIKITSRGSSILTLISSADSRPYLVVRYRRDFRPISVEFFFNEQSTNRQFLSWPNR